MFFLMVLRVGDILELAGRESLSWYDTCFQLKRRYSENMTASVQRPSQVVSCSGRPVIVCKGTFSTHFQRKQKPKIPIQPQSCWSAPSVCCPQSICPAANNFFLHVIWGRWPLNMSPTITMTIMVLEETGCEKIIWLGITRDLRQKRQRGQWPVEQLT